MSKLGEILGIILVKILDYLLGKANELPTSETAKTDPSLRARLLARVRKAKDNIRPPK